ncbi:MAG: 50S ribosomal protein L6 [Gemmataceae bacterium]|nr:50S ribosomal protein L6 [Gemmataceae bacterium]
MSRIGKLPVTVPANVKVAVNGLTVKVEGPKGTLEQTFLPVVKVDFDAGAKQVKVTRGNDERFSRAAHGLTRALIANMIQGVATGYEKKLKIEGIGYQARSDKGAVVLTVGYSNPISLKPPAGVTFEVPDPTTIIVKGADKQKVGQFAAEIRAARKPEPYKGKGVRYENEVVRRKEGKSFASGG